MLKRIYINISKATWANVRFFVVPCPGSLKHAFRMGVPSSRLMNDGRHGNGDKYMAGLYVDRIGWLLLKTITIFYAKQRSLLFACIAWST